MEFELLKLAKVLERSTPAATLRVEPLFRRDRLRLSEPAAKPPSPPALDPPLPGMIEQLAIGTIGRNVGHAANVCDGVSGSSIPTPSRNPGPDAFDVGWHRPETGGGGPDGFSGIRRAKVAVVLLDHTRVGMAEVLRDYQKRRAVHHSVAAVGVP